MNPTHTRCRRALRASSPLDDHGAREGNPLEKEGVLTLPTAWGADGELYLFPRLVEDGNVSRVGRARVVIENGEPVGVELLGVVSRPTRGGSTGRATRGSRISRITFVEPLGLHVMTYIAYGPLGPKPALAVSDDTVTWRRLGPVRFAYQPELDTDLNLFPNKTTSFSSRRPSRDPTGDLRSRFSIAPCGTWTGCAREKAPRPPRVSTTTVPRSG